MDRKTKLGICTQSYRCFTMINISRTNSADMKHIDDFRTTRIPTNIFSDNGKHSTGTTTDCYYLINNQIRYTRARLHEHVYLI